MTQWRQPFGLSDKGRKRSNNEDSYEIHIPPDPRLAQIRGTLLMVADGMGGHRGGEVASQIAKDAIRNAYFGAQLNVPIKDALLQAVRFANKMVYERSQIEPSLKGMGTTCTVVALVNDTVTIAQVGDSRAYHLHGYELHRITRDHTFVQDLVDRGILTEEGAKQDPRAHVITRSLGGSPTVEVDLFEGQLDPGDRLLLCTDGLNGELTSLEIGEILAHSLSAEQAGQSLVQAALARGGKDNVTVIVFQPEVQRTTPATNPLPYSSKLLIPRTGRKIPLVQPRRAGVAAPNLGEDRNPRRRTIWIAVSVAAVAVLALGAFLVFRNINPPLLYVNVELRSNMPFSFTCTDLVQEKVFTSTTSSTMQTIQGISNRKHTIEIMDLDEYYEPIPTLDLLGTGSGTVNVIKLEFPRVQREVTFNISIIGADGNSVDLDSPITLTRTDEKKIELPAKNGGAARILEAGEWSVGEIVEGYVLDENSAAAFAVTRSGENIHNLTYLSPYGVLKIDSKIGSKQVRATITGDIEGITPTTLFLRAGSYSFVLETSEGGSTYSVKVGLEVKRNTKQELNPTLIKVLGPPAPEPQPTSESQPPPEPQPEPTLSASPTPTLTGTPSEMLDKRIAGTITEAEYLAWLAQWVEAQTPTITATPTSS